MQSCIRSLLPKGGPKGPCLGEIPCYKKNLSCKEKVFFFFGLGGGVGVGGGGGGVGIAHANRFQKLFSENYHH